MSQAQAFLAVVSLIFQKRASGKADRAAAQGLEVQRRQQEVQIRRKRLETRRRARFARAEALQQSTISGARGSGIEGAIGSISSQEASLQANLTQLGQFQGSFIDAKLRESAERSSAATFGSIANVSFKAFEAGGGFKNLFQQRPSGLSVGSIGVGGAESTGATIFG